MRSTAKTSIAKKNPQFHFEYVWLVLILLAIYFTIINYQRFKVIAPNEPETPVNVKPDDSSGPVIDTTIPLPIVLPKTSWYFDLLYPVEKFINHDVSIWFQTQLSWRQFSSNIVKYSEIANDVWSEIDEVVIDQNNALKNLITDSLPALLGLITPIVSYAGSSLATQATTKTLPTSDSTALVLRSNPNKRIKNRPLMRIAFKSTEVNDNSESHASLIESAVENVFVQIIHFLNYMASRITNKIISGQMLSLSFLQKLKYYLTGTDTTLTADMLWVADLTKLFVVDLISKLVTLVAALLSRVNRLSFLDLQQFDSDCIETWRNCLVQFKNGLISHVKS